MDAEDEEWMVAWCYQPSVLLFFALYQVAEQDQSQKYLHQNQTVNSIFAGLFLITLYVKSIIMESW